MMLGGRMIDMNIDYMSPVTYIPNHANGNAAHPDCELGVLMSFNDEDGYVRVLYCRSRTVQSTRPEDLVWG